MSVTNIDENLQDKYDGKVYQSEWYLWGLIAALNVLFLAGRIASVSNFWVCYLLTNILLVKLQSTKVKKPETLQEASIREEREEDEIDKINRANELLSDLDPVQLPHKIASVEAGSTFERATPLPNSEVAAVFEKFGEKSCEGGEPRASAASGRAQLLPPFTTKSNSTPQTHVHSPPNPLFFALA
tara:strand:- start:131 stop:685 length:555 start_codon:yes stop_codon:yes gene_type:complete